MVCDSFGGISKVVKTPLLDIYVNRISVKHHDDVYGPRVFTPIRVHYNVSPQFLNKNKCSSYPLTFLYFRFMTNRVFVGRGQETSKSYTTY